MIKHVENISRDQVATYKDADLENGNIIFNNNIQKIQLCQPQIVLTTFSINDNTLQINTELTQIQNFCLMHDIEFANLPSPSGTRIQFLPGGVDTCLQQWRSIFYHLQNW
jgi:hypothetical protein